MPVFYWPFKGGSMKKLFIIMSFLLALPGFAQMRSGETKESNMTSHEMSENAYKSDTPMGGQKEMKGEIQKEEETSTIQERKKTQYKKRKKDRMKKVQEDESTEGISTP